MYVGLFVYSAVVFHVFMFFRVFLFYVDCADNCAVAFYR